VRLSGTDAREDVFFRLDPRSPDFAGSVLHGGKCLAIEGLLFGESESSLSYTKVKECFQLFEVRCERLGGETPGAFKPFSFL
jgi:hypothetical protein